MLRIVLGFIAAVIVGFIVGAAALSWFDQAGYLQASGGNAALSLGDRLAWFAENLKGLSLTVHTYPQLLAVGLLVAFLAAHFARMLAPDLRPWWYAGAGAVAMVVLVLALKFFLGLKVLPGARTSAGIAGQALAGFLAGLTYAAVSRDRRSRITR